MRIYSFDTTVLSWVFLITISLEISSRKSWEKKCYKQSNRFSHFPQVEISWDLTYILVETQKRFLHESLMYMGLHEEGACRNLNKYWNFILTRFSRVFSIEIIFSRSFLPEISPSFIINEISTLSQMRFLHGDLYSEKIKNLIFIIDAEKTLNMFFRTGYLDQNLNCKLEFFALVSF